MTFKDAYRKYNLEITPEPETVGELLAVAKEKQEGKRGGKKIAVLFIKYSAAVVAVCLCLLITTPVLAEYVPPLEGLLQLISPELAECFIPVQMAQEKHGIRMEVVAINPNEEGVQVYITMQDLQGDLLDETTDLYDSYSLNIPFDCVSNCQNLGYDKETKTISFLININAMEGEDTGKWLERIGEKKITFSVGKIISKKKEYDYVEIPISLTEVMDAPETMQVKLSGKSGEGSWGNIQQGDAFDPRSSARVLVPMEGNPDFPIEGISLTGMGYVDGCLHIQTAVENIHENDNHGNFMLKDREGNVHICDGMLSFWGQTSDTEHIAYQDDVFVIPKENLDNYTLYGYFVTSGVQLEGNWKVKFSLK